ncbi:hypothetical protein [Azonexus sp.]|uniref:hypothetical protein n=1 Tax=Azonexus sp. TaxID=1872668 RepID=UPI0027B98E56|nr:hypothetical protein [Azonexus sp.]
MNPPCFPKPRRLILALLSLLGPLAAPALQAEPGRELYQRYMTQAASNDCIELDIDLAHGETFTVDGKKLRYSMYGKDIAEGWSWPEQQPVGGDYFRYKYLPLASESEDRRSYVAEDKVGEPQTMIERWRYDYFLAFNNLAAFIQADDDDAALSLALPDDYPPEALALHASACLTTPNTRESTTFWKATHSTPVDLTLKKRYLIGELKALYLIDRNDGRHLAELLPGTARPTPASHKENP